MVVACRIGEQMGPRMLAEGTAMYCVAPRHRHAFRRGLPGEAPSRAGKTRPNLQCGGASLSGRLLAVGLESEKLEAELDE